MKIEKYLVKRLDANNIVVYDTTSINKSHPFGKVLGYFGDIIAVIRFLLRTLPAEKIPKELKEVLIRQEKAEKAILEVLKRYEGTQYD